MYMGGFESSILIMLYKLLIYATTTTHMQTAHIHTAHMPLIPLAKETARMLFAYERSTYERLRMYMSGCAYGQSAFRMPTSPRYTWPGAHVSGLLYVQMSGLEYEWFPDDDFPFRCAKERFVWKSI